MSNVIDGFISKKDAESPFISLKSGESAKVVKVTGLKTIIKQGFKGDEVEVLRLVCDVETTEGIKSKNFDNGTKRFAEALAAANVGLGSGFTLTRDGEGLKTSYAITDVTSPAAI